MKRIIFIVALILSLFLCQGVEARGIFPAVSIDLAATEVWATWDESTEEGLATDDIFVALMENVNTGGNETAQGGGLSGVSLVLTQVGNISGATTTPRTRYFDHADDYMTTATVQTLIGQPAWTWIMKVNLLAIGDNTYGCFFGVPGGDYLYLFLNGADNTLKLYLMDGGVLTVNTVSTVGTVSTGIQWWAIWYDGTNIRWGFTTTRPTKLSDFNSNNRGSAAWASGRFTGTWSNVERPVGHNARPIYGYVYYVIMSKACLIDNGL
jgi:hypothetical protein